MNIYVDILANLIIQQYFVNERCLLIFVDKDNNFDYTENVAFVKIKFSVDLNFDTAFRSFGCQSIVVKTNTPETFFKKFEYDIKHGEDRFLSRKYLFISGDDQQENFDSIFNTTEIKFVADILMLEESDQTVLIWSNKYVENDEKVLVDKWYVDNETFLYDNDLYRNKLQNQMGRRLGLSTFHYEPYSILIENDPFRSKGSELRSLVMYAEKHNMTPNLVVNEGEYWGDIYDNWTGVGALGNVIYDRADCTFGAMYTWDQYHLFLEYSKPTVRSGITLIVPSPKTLAGWLTPIYAYNSAIWTTLAILFIISIILLYLNYSTYFKKFNLSNLSNSTFTVIKLFLSQTLPEFNMLQLPFTGRYFMLMMFVFEVFLSSTYSSGLSSIMTVPRYEKPIDNRVDMAESGKLWGATSTAWITSIEGSSDPIDMVLVKHFRVLDEDTLADKARGGDFVFSVERLGNEEYAISPYIGRDVVHNFRLMSSDLYWEQCVIMFRKNSILLPSFDALLLQLLQFGFISHWQSEAVYLYMDSTVQKTVKYSDKKKNKEHDIVKLKWSHVEGAFAILCIGNLMGFIVFVMERVHYKLHTY